MATPRADPQQAAVMPVVFGAISATSWLYAAFVGVAKPVAAMLGYMGFMGMFAGLTLAGIGFAMLTVRPRLPHGSNVPTLPSVPSARAERAYFQSPRSSATWSCRPAGRCAPAAGRADDSSIRLNRPRPQGGSGRAVLAREHAAPHPAQRHWHDRDRVGVQDARDARPRTARSHRRR